MTLGTKSLLALSLCGALFASACKKKEDAAGAASGTGSGTATATAAPATVDAAAAAPVVDAAAAADPVDAAQPAAASLTPELEALDKTIAPILAMTDEDARTKAACKALDDITTKMAAVRKAPPAGVDAAKWNETAEGMAEGLRDFELECGEGSASNTKALAQAAETAKELQAMLATKAP